MRSESLVGWSSDLESGGRRFDSRLPEGHFGVTFSNFGMSWDLSRSGLGKLSDGFRMVLKKMLGGVKRLTFSKLAGSICPASGYTQIACLAYPRPKNYKF